MKENIIVDLDGVLAEYKEWNPVIGKPIIGSAIGLGKLREKGFNIIIQTCRLHSCWGSKQFKDQYLQLVKWLNKNKIPYDEIDIFGKAIGKYYIDDRGIRFDSWDNVLRFIEENEKGE